MSRQHPKIILLQPIKNNFKNITMALNNELIVRILATVLTNKLYDHRIII